jgi:hypothetical protein
VMASGQAVIWGGEHVHLEIARNGADLEFDCATGRITEPVPEKDGPFSLKGTFTPERSGPSRDDGPSAIAATYSGTIKNDTLTLRIVLSGPGNNERQEMSYTLVRGQPGNVRKCRAVFFPAGSPESSRPSVPDSQIRDNR